MLLAATPFSASVGAAPATADIEYQVVPIELLEFEIGENRLLLEMLESDLMPPEDEPQPNQVDRKAIINWIEAGLRDNVAQPKQ